MKMKTLPVRPVHDTSPNPHARPSAQPLCALLRRAAPPRTPPPAAAQGLLTLGRVNRALADETWHITLPSGETVSARAAVSCLVKPQPDDLVQIYQTPLGCWVLAVLERSDTTQIDLDFGTSGVALRARELHIQTQDRVGLYAAHFESRAHVITQAAGERFAYVSGTDSTQAGNSFVHADKHMGIHARSTSLSADSLLKVDAGQIHMG